MVLTERDWYSQKELFEQITSLKMDFQEIRLELKETRETIKKYNGLREQLHSVESDLATMKAASGGKATVAKGIREWGGWIVAIVAVAIDIFTR